MNRVFFMTCSELQSPVTFRCCCWEDSFLVAENRNCEVLETLDDLCFINLSSSIKNQQKTRQENEELVTMKQSQAVCYKERIS